MVMVAALEVGAELIGALNDLTDLGEKVFSCGISSKKAVAAVGHLHYQVRGSRSPLERIAAGQGTAADLAALKEALAFSERKVNQSIAALKQLDTEKFQKKYGLAAKDKLEEILYGEVCKGQTRDLLNEIVKN